MCLTLLFEQNWFQVRKSNSQPENFIKAFKARLCKTNIFVHNYLIAKGQHRTCWPTFSLWCHNWMALQTVAQLWHHIEWRQKATWKATCPEISDRSIVNGLTLYPNLLTLSQEIEKACRTPTFPRISWVGETRWLGLRCLQQMASTETGPHFRPRKTCHGRL